MLYCYNSLGHYIGSLDELIQFLKIDCIEDPEYSGVLFSKKLNGWIGFNSKASQIFKIGDKLFNENWKFNSFADLSKKTVKKFLKLPTIDSEDKESLMNYVPFVERGSEVIRNSSQGRQAAINFSNYIRA